jgi:hypothetical protein
MCSRVGWKGQLKKFDRDSTKFSLVSLAFLVKEMSLRMRFIKLTLYLDSSERNILRAYQSKRSLCQPSLGRFSYMFLRHILPAIEF